MRGSATRRTWRREVWLLVGLVALIATSLPGLVSAAEEEGGKNLSVPAIYIGSGGPATWAPCGAAVAPTGETSTFPDDFVLPLTGVTPGEYYVQGEDLWQASCMTGTTGLAVDPSWGDNLTGAPLKVGTPVRIEIGLLPDDMTPYASMTGYEVVKLTDELDRLATYGTLGLSVTPYPEVRVWAADATYSVQNTATSAYVVPEGTPFGAEINSTGRIVYGAQLQVTEAGTYDITFTSSNVVFDDGGDSTTISIIVKAAAGGGKGSGGGGNGGGGGRPDNPGGGQGDGGGGGPRGPK